MKKPVSKTLVTIGITFAVLLLVNIILPIAQEERNKNNVTPKRPEVMEIVSYAVDSTDCVQTDDGKYEYYVYLWNDIDEKCMQYQTRSASVFSALTKLIGYEVRIAIYDDTSCFWGEDYLENGRVIENYYNKIQQ